jgi:hypothetical protein
LDPGQFPAALVMTPEDIVEASLKGLQLGEVICVPALDEPDLLWQVQEYERRVLEHSQRGILTTRY